MALARLHGSDIANGQIVDADDLNEEFNQLVNILNGTSNDKDAIIKLSSATLAALLLNQQNSSGPVQIWQLNGTDKIKINNLAQLESLLSTGTAPLVVASTTKVNNLNADLLDGLDSAAFAQLASAKVSFAIEFTITDPATCNLGSREFGSFIVPNGGTYTFTKAKVMFRTGSHTSGASLQFKVDQVGVGDRATLNLNDTNNTVGAIYADDFADFTQPENAIFSCYLNTRSGTITEKDVTVSLEGYRTIF